MMQQIFQQTLNYLLHKYHDNNAMVSNWSGTKLKTCSITASYTFIASAHSVDYSDVTYAIGVSLLSPIGLHPMHLTHHSHPRMMRMTHMLPVAPCGRHKGPSITHPTYSHILWMMRMLHMLPMASCCRPLVYPSYAIAYPWDAAMSRMLPVAPGGRPLGSPFCAIAHS